MSVGEVTARIGQIQSDLSRLAGGSSTQDAGPAAGAAFSQVLGAAQTGADALVPSGAGGVPLRAGSPGLAGTGPTGAVGLTSPRGGAATGGADGQAVVAAARKYLGIPYAWGGTDPSKGLDCSGLVQLVYKQFGIDLPRVSRDQAQAGRAVAGMAQARPGDILAFNSPVDHVGIYIGGGKMIEAPRTGLDVRIADVPETPTAIRRVLPEPTVAGAARVVGASSSLGGGTPYASLFESAGRRYGVSPTLLAAVAQQESGFDARAVSPAGAQGLMQLMPSTASGLGVRNSFDPDQAVDGAARLLRDLLGEFGRVDLALAAYNAGPGAVHRYGGIPPYPETRSYVPSVLAHKAALERA